MKTGNFRHTYGAAPLAHAVGAKEILIMQTPMEFRMEHFNGSSQFVLAERCVKDLRQGQGNDYCF